MRYVKGLGVTACALSAVLLIVCFVAWKWLLVPPLVVRVVILIWLVLAAYWAMRKSVREAKERGWLGDGS